MENHSNQSLHVMSILRLIVMLAAQLEFSYSSSWLSSTDNALADCASCFMYAQLFKLAPHLKRQPTLPHPPTIGIKRMLTSPDLQHFGSGMASPPAPELHTRQVRNPSLSSFLATHTSAMLQEPFCLPPIMHFLSGSHSLVPARSSQKQSNPTSLMYAPRTWITTSRLRPASPSSCNKWLWD